MKIFFDVDYTLIAEDGSLRPFVHEVLEKLVADGHQIYIWSGVGIRWDVIRRHRLREYLQGCFTKPLSDYRRSLPAYGVNIEPDYCIDDYPEVIEAFGGTAIRAYLAPDPTDEEMLRVHREILAFADERGRI